MQIEQLLFNQYMYKKGGDIEGDYKFKKGTKVSMKDDADIELAPEESRLQQIDDENNYLCFRQGETYINLDLDVGGNIHAAQLDVDGLNIAGDLNVPGKLTVAEDSTFNKKVTAETVDVTNLNVTDLTLNTLTVSNLSATTLTSNMHFDHALSGKGSLHVYDQLQYKHTVVTPGMVQIYDSNPLNNGSITLNGTTGKLNCNGGISAYNTNPLTNLLNPKGVYTDYIETGAHRSDFGVNAGGQSISALGEIAANEFHVPYFSAAATHLGGITLTSTYHTVALQAPRTYTNEIYATAMSHTSDAHIQLQTDKISFAHAKKLYFSTLGKDDVIDWPLLTNAEDSTDGVDVEGTLACTTVAADSANFHSLTLGLSGTGVVDFTEVEKLDFTGLASGDIVGWPLHGTNHVIDTTNGATVYSNDTHQSPGTLTAGAVISEHANHKDLLVGLNGAGTVDFTQIGTLDFTGVTTAQFVNWPWAHPDGLANIHDTATGVEIDGDIKVGVLKPVDPNVNNRLQLSDYYDVQVHDLLVESILPSPQLPDGILRINGFDQVRVGDELNVIGRSILTDVTVTGVIDAHSATFDSNVGIDGTLTVDTIRADSVGQSDDLRTKYFDGPGLPYIGHIIGPGVVGMFRQTQIDFLVPVFAPNIDSSGSFTHCHVCEPVDQTTDWGSLTGRLIESTGLCAVRDNVGNLGTDFTQAPSLNHAMTSVQLAETTCLGVLNSVELVADGQVNHAHGITLTHKVAEADGHKILRVCGAGDTYVWVVKPVANEILLTPSMCSGLFEKYVNGVLQDEKVVVTCHDDFSFQMVINLPTVTNRLAALEEAFAALVNS